MLLAAKISVKAEVLESKQASNGSRDSRRMLMLTQRAWVAGSPPLAGGRDRQCHAVMEAREFASSQRHRPTAAWSLGTYQSNSRDEWSAVRANDINSRRI